MNEMYAFIICNSYEDKNELYKEEFIALTSTAGYHIIGGLSQSVSEPNPSTYIGSGFLLKVKEEIENLSQITPNLKENLVIATSFDLNGTQRANIKKALNIEVVDRTFIILKIFENNAHTPEAKLQVEIASLTWSKNHLIDADEGFSQVTSGSGMHNKGSGEKQLTLDRRHINILIRTKKKKLEAIKLARKSSRTRRNASGIYKVAVVGYTNAGKSTLINGFLSFSKGDKKVLTEDKMFATLETATREINKFGYMKLLLTDTVGFIRNLPTTLVNAFKSTLEEIKEADILLHLVDISSPNYQMEIDTTNEVLEEIGVKDIPIIYLYNKYDLLKKPMYKSLESNAMYSSLLNDEDIEDIYRFICSNISKDWEVKQIEFPYELDFAKFSSDNYIISQYKNKNGYQCTVAINPRTKHKYDYLFDKKS